MAGHCSREDLSMHAPSYSNWRLFLSNDRLRRLSVSPSCGKVLVLKSHPLHPALSPVNVADYPYREISGVSFSECMSLSVWRNEKKMAEASGDLLFYP